MGVGIGFRRDFFHSLFETQRRVDWLELVSENFVGLGGVPRLALERASQRWPLVFHSTSLSLGGPDPIRAPELEGLRDLIARHRVPWASDHLCFSSVGGNVYHDLLPLPRTSESVRHISRRIRQVQEELEVPFAVEHISAVVDVREDSTMTEAEFVAAVLQESGAGLLLDVNNLRVNQINHGWDPIEFLDKIPLKQVYQIHLAGHRLDGGRAIDDHGSAVSPEVWDLYRLALRRIGRPVSTLIEWDHDIPSLDAVLDEADRARAIREELS